MALNLSKEDLLELATTLRALGSGEHAGPTAEQKKRAKKIAEIKEKAHKNATHAFYVVGEQGAYREGVRYSAGQVIKVPLDENPSHTWRPAGGKGIAEAARKEKLKVDEAADLVAEGDDEADEAEADEVDEAPKKPAKAAKKPAKGSRAADQDVG
jgi:hypothetical protein